MGEGEKLWDKYCSFLDKPFPKRLEYNEGLAEEYFKRWKQTKMAKLPQYKQVKLLEDVPPTDYADYPILKEFGEKMQEMAKTIPRGSGERFWDYYVRIGEKVSPMLDGWMTDKYAFCMRTSGYSGESKWIAHGSACLKNYLDDALTAAILICSDSRGSTKIRKGDRIIQLSAPPPYASGIVLQAWETIFDCVPPSRITENVSSMGKKLQMIFKLIEKGGEFAFLSITPSLACMMADFLADRKKFFQEQFRSYGLGLKKFGLLLMYLANIKSRKYQKANEILHLKGVATGGVDGRLYADKLKYHFEMEPWNIYGSSEGGVAMMGAPEDKMGLVPILRSSYLEFLDEDGDVKKLDELKKGRVYEVLVTPFGSSLIRYRIGDRFRVKDFMDDRAPVFSFESRKQDVIDILGYYRIATAIVLNALKEASWEAVDNWVLVKVSNPKDHLLFLMEKRWSLSEEEASKILFNSLQKVFADFRSYVKDFGIRDPSEALQVEYLKKGAFMRYLMRKTKEGAPLGQLKPPKLIKDETSKDVSLLRG